MNRRWSAVAGAWLLGLGAAVLALGPALGRGSLLSLDLVFTPRFPVPPGVWGLGPELPRRVPLGAPIAWLAHFIGGEAVGKALLLLSLAGCVAGAALLARRLGASTVASAGGGLIYGLSPFTLTRLGAGHWVLLAAMAVLPFVVTTLGGARPNPRRTFLAALALGLTGFVGGLFAIVVHLTAEIVNRGSRGRLKRTVALLTAQLPWVVPGAIVVATGPKLLLADGFATRVGILTAPSLVAGQGFWRATSQVGPSALPATLAGLALFSLAWFGRSRLTGPVARVIGISALVATVVALARVVPGLKQVYAVATGVPGASVLRESQRLLPLLLLWVAVASAAGVDRMAARLRPQARPLATVGLAVAALLLAGPGLWGVNGRLKPVDLPSGYADAARIIDGNPGTVLALPWHQYLDLSYADGRRVLNPLPDRLGGDVLASADPELGEGGREDLDRRGPAAARIERKIRRGEDAADEMGELGVRWVVLLEEVNWRDYSALDRDEQMWRTPTGAGLRLYENQGMSLVIHDDSIPPGRGLLWFWPTFLVLISDAVVLIILVWVVWSLSHDRD